MAKDKKAKKADVEKPKMEAKQDYEKEIELVRAEVPQGAEPLSIEDLDLESTVKEAEDLFKKRAKTSTLTTQDMVDATEEVIKLIADGHTWDESKELREAFKRVPNSFAKGPVLTTNLQLLCGKIAQFDKIDVAVWKIGSKIGNRQVLQDDAGFVRVTGRLPVSQIEAEIEGIKADTQVPHSYISHCPHYEGLLFWASEPQHQVTSPPAAKRLKKSVSGGVISGLSQKERLEQRLEAYRRVLNSTDKDAVKTAAKDKIAKIEESLKNLAEEAA